MTPHILTPERPHWWTLAAIGMVGFLGLLVMGFDQGQVLSLIQGNIAFDQNLVHEFLHDARHVAGFPCH